MEKILVDTSAIYALLDRSDAHHQQAVSILHRLGELHHELTLTNFILAESHALILAKLGANLARKWLLEVHWPVERAAEADEKLASKIIAEYHDKDFSYTDAVSFAIMERLGLSKAFAYDKHFIQYGFDVIA